MPFSAEERDIEYCRSILEAFQHIQQYIDGMKRPEFMMDAKTQDAVAMRLQQVLECSGKLSVQSKEKVQINWSSLTAMRNKISHHYENIDPAIVWEVIDDFAEFKKLIDFAKKRI